MTLPSQKTKTKGRLSPLEIEPATFSCINDDAHCFTFFIVYSVLFHTSLRKEARVIHRVFHREWKYCRSSLPQSLGPQDGLATDD